MKNFKKVLSLFMAVCFVVSSLCSLTAFAADESYMEVTYSRDFTKLTSADGTWSNNNLNYKIDDLEAASIYRSETNMSPVTVSESGIGSTKGYFCYNKELSGKYNIAGTFNLKNMGGSNELTFYLNRTYNSSNVGTNNINAPVGTDGFHIYTKSTSKTENDEAVLGLIVKVYRGSTSDANKILEETVYPGTRLACDEDVDFSFNYDNGSLDVDFSTASGTAIYEKNIDLKSWCETNSVELKNSGVFAMKTNDLQTETANYFMLKNMTVKEEYTTGRVTLFEEDFNALVTELGVSGATNYDKYDIDSLGWSTYSSKTNSSSTGGDTTGQMELFKGTTPAGLMSDGSGTAVYNTNLGNNFVVNTKICHWSVSDLKLWFNAKFSGTTPQTGFYFMFDSSKNLKLVYTDGTTEYELYSAATTATYCSNFDSTYTLNYDNGVIKITAVRGDYTDDVEINLAEKLSEKSVSDFDTTGKFAIQSNSSGGFIDIRNVSISASVADVALAEKVTDGDTVSTSAVYQSPQLTPVNVIAAAYDATGALIAVDVKSGTNSIGKIDFEMEKSVSADAKKVKFFLIDTLEKLTPMCAAEEITVQ